MDLDQAKLFLQQLDQSENPSFAFRTFDDIKERNNPSLICMRYGKFDDLKDEFIRINTGGGGIFYTVNRTNGQGFKKEDVVSVRAVFADLDGSPLAPAADFRLKPQIVIQSSPGRYHVIWIIDKNKPLALPLFEPVQTRIAELFNSDPTMKDLGRVLRLPGYYHKKKEPYLVNLVSTHNQPPSYSADQILDAFGTTKAGKPKQLPIAIPQGQRDTRLTSFAGGFRRMGATEEAILAALEVENQRCIPPLEPAELARIAKSVCKYEPSTPAGDFIRDKDGKIYPNNQQNIKIALEKMDVQVKYNIFANQYLYQRGKEPDLFLDDIALKHIWLEGDEAFRFRPSKDFFEAVVMDRAAHQGKFHPVKQYLDSLKWDGKERLDTWLIEYGGAEDSEYARTVGRLVLLAAVRRIKQPGCVFQEMLVMESEQGKEKSTTIKALCPDESWFSDGVGLDITSQKVIEQTSGKWIIEVSEMAGMKKSDIEHVKTFLSQTHDVARLAYDRMVTTRARGFVLIGTTNSNQYLKDSTGNRRFWPLRTPQFSVKRLTKDRDQLWAEAVAKEAVPGCSIRLPLHLWAIAQIQQERRKIDEPWETRIVETIGELRGKILTEDIWKIVGMFDMSRRTQAQSIVIGEAMRRLGFDRNQIRMGHTIKHGYMKAETDMEKKQFIRIRIDDGLPEAFIEGRGDTVMEWEKAAPTTEGDNEKAKT